MLFPVAEISDSIRHITFVLIEDYNCLVQNVNAREDSV